MAVLNYYRGSSIEVKTTCNARSALMNLSPLLIRKIGVYPAEPPALSMDPDLDRVHAERIGSPENGRRIKVEQRRAKK